jgi:GNAT superfamily N-acetyltransferase
MSQMPLARLMQPEDLSIVLDIQVCCHDESKLESRHSFLAKLQASPATCFIGMVDGEPVAYLMAVPAVAGSPPPLNRPDFSAPPGADALYLHDLAVHPAARGTGVAAVLVEAYFGAARRSGFRFACLTAVNDAESYWARYGFLPAVLADSGSARMVSYGEGAQYMSMRIG